MGFGKVRYGLVRYGVRGCWFILTTSYIYLLMIGCEKIETFICENKA